MVSPFTSQFKALLHSYACNIRKLEDYQRRLCWTGGFINHGKSKMSNKKKTTKLYVPYADLMAIN